MGNAQKKKARMLAINEAIRKREELDRKSRAKLLFLGQGGSGRSTVVEQLRRKFAKPEENVLSKKDIELWRTVIFRMVLRSMAALLKVSEDCVPLSDPTLEDAKEHIIAQYGSYYYSPPGAFEVMNDNIKDMLVSLWNDEGIRATYEIHQGVYHVSESLEYFMNDAERILKQDFEINELDRLHARLRTTGVHEIKFEVNDIKFSALDVGGARNERRKWLHAFENITAIVYVSAINEYDQGLFEDSSVNSLSESMYTFDRTVNHELFAETDMFVFLNKSDLFRRKITRSPIKHHDPNDPKQNRWEDFDGPSAVGLEPSSTEFAEAYEAATQYFTDKFKALDKRSSGKAVIVQVICAFDNAFADQLMQKCQEMISSNLLKEQALVDDNP